MSLAAKNFVLVFTVEPTDDVGWRECSTAQQIEQFDWVNKEKTPNRLSDMVQVLWPEGGVSHET